MAGGLLQLIANGSQDILLTRNPELTFFKTVYRRHNNFSIDTKLIKLKNPNFNSRIDLNIPKIGDLVNNIMLKLDIPYVSAKYNLEIKEQIQNFLVDRNIYKLDEMIFKENINLIEVCKVILNYTLGIKSFKNNYYLLELDDYENIYQLLHNTDIIDNSFNIKEIKLKNSNINNYLFNNEKYNEDLNNGIINNIDSNIKKSIIYNDFTYDISEITNLEELNINIGQLLIYNDVYEVINLYINNLKKKEAKLKLYTIDNIKLRFQDYIENNLILNKRLETYYKIENKILKYKNLNDFNNTDDNYIDLVVDNSKFRKEDIRNDPTARILKNDTLILDGANVIFLYKELISYELVITVQQNFINSNFIYLRDVNNKNNIVKFGIKFKTNLSYYIGNKKENEIVNGSFLIIKFIESVSNDFIIKNIEDFKVGDYVNLDFSVSETFSSFKRVDLLYNFKYNNNIENILYNQHGVMIFFDNKNFINNCKLLKSNYDDIFNFKILINEETFTKSYNNLQPYYEILLYDDFFNNNFNLFENYKNNNEKIYLTSNNNFLNFKNNRDYYSELRILENIKDIENTDNLYLVSDDNFIEYNVNNANIKTENGNVKDFYSVGEVVKIYFDNDINRLYNGRIIEVFPFYDDNGISVYSNYNYNVKLTQGQKIYPNKLVKVKIVLYNDSLLKKIDDENNLTYYEHNDKLDIRSSFYITKEGDKFDQILKYTEINNFCIVDETNEDLKIDVKLNFYPEDVDFISKSCSLTIKKRDIYESEEQKNNRENMIPISLREIKINNYLLNKLTNERFKITDILESLYLSDTILHFDGDYLADFFITKIVGLIELSYDEKVIKIEVNDNISRWYLKEGDTLYIYKTSTVDYIPVGIFKILEVNNQYYTLKELVFEKTYVSDDDYLVYGAQNTLYVGLDVYDNLVVEELSYYEKIRNIIYKKNSTYSTYKYIDDKNNNYLNNLGTLEYNNLIDNNINKSIVNNVKIFRNIVTSLFRDENSNSKVNHIFRSFDYDSLNNNFNGISNEVFIDNNLLDTFQNSFYRDIDNEDLNNNSILYPSIDLLKIYLKDYKNYFLNSILNYTNKKFLEKSNFGVDTSYNSVGDYVKKIDFLMRNRIYMNIDLENNKVYDNYIDFNYNIGDILNIYDETLSIKDMSIEIKEIDTYILDEKKFTRLTVDYKSNYSYVDNEFISIIYYVGRNLDETNKISKIYNTGFFKLDEYNYKFNDNVDSLYNDGILNHNVNFIGNHIVNYLLIDFIIQIYNILYIDENSVAQKLIINTWNYTLFINCYKLYDYIFNLFNQDKYVSKLSTNKCNLQFVYNYENLINNSILEYQILFNLIQDYNYYQQINLDTLKNIFGYYNRAENENFNLLKESLLVVLSSKTIDNVYYTIEKLEDFNIFVTRQNEGIISLESLLNQFLNEEISKYEDNEFIEIFLNHSITYKDFIFKILNFNNNFSRPVNYEYKLGTDYLYLMDFCVENNLFNFYEKVLDDDGWIENNIQSNLLANLDRFFVIFTNYSNYYVKKNLLNYKDNKNLLKITGSNFIGVEENSNNLIINNLINEIHNNYDTNQLSNGNYFITDTIFSLNTKEKYLYQDIDFVFNALNYSNFPVLSYTIKNYYELINVNNNIINFYNYFSVVKLFENIFESNFKDIVDRSNIIKYLKNKINLGLTDEKVINENLIEFINEIKTLNSNLRIEDMIFYKNEIITREEYNNIKNIINNIDNQTDQQNIVRLEIEEIKRKIPFYIFEILISNKDQINNNITLLENKISENYLNYKLYKYCILTLDEYNLVTNKSEGNCIVNQIDSIGRIKSVLIVNGGYNYLVGDIVCFSYGNGKGARARVKNVNLLEITELDIIDGGEEYELDDNLIINIFNLPNGLSYKDNNYLRIVRNTDLPDNLYYEKNSKTLSRLDLLTNDTFYLYNITFFIKKQLCLNLDIDNFLNESSGDIISINSYELNNNYLVVESENHNLEKGQFIIIKDLVNYSNNFIIKEIVDTNNFIIKNKFIDNQNNLKWYTGLDLILNDNIFNIYFNLEKSINIMLTQNEFVKDILERYDEKYIYKLGLDYSNFTNKDYFNIIINEILNDYYMKKNKFVINKEINSNNFIRYDYTELYEYEDTRYNNQNFVNGVEVKNSISVSKNNNYFIIKTNSIPDYDVNKYYQYINNTLNILDTDNLYFTTGKKNIIKEFNKYDFGIPLYPKDPIEKLKGIFWGEGDFNYKDDLNPLKNNIIIGVSVNGVLLTSNKNIDNNYDIYGGFADKSNLYQYNKYPSILFNYNKLLDNENLDNESYIYQHNLVQKIKDKLLLLGINGHSSILGYALDGYPIYGPIGFKDEDLSEVKLMKSSYIKQPNGEYRYVKNYGDLDICNGIFSPTPEYPLGIYHYHMTIEINEDGTPKEKFIKNYQISNENFYDVVPAYPYIIGNFRGIPNFELSDEDEKEVINNIIKPIRSNDQYYNQIFNLSKILDINDKIGDIEYESNYMYKNLDNYLVELNENFDKYNLVKSDIEKIKLREKDSPANFAWIKRLGNFLINSVELSIDGQIIDKFDGHRINIFSELYTTRGKVNGYAKMIGHVKSLINFDKNPKPSYSLYIPLPFWFNNRSGLSLPILCLNNSELKFSLDISKFEDCIFVDEFTTFTNKLNLSGNLLVDYIYLDEKERELFATSKHEYLIEQNQFYTQYINKNEIEIPIKFNNCVKDINWVVQKTKFINNNNHHNYGMTDSNDNSNNGNPIEEAYIKFNGLNRIKRQSGNYFNYVVPFQNYIATPRDGINCYSFSLKPFIFQPTGSCNFSFLEDEKLYLKLKEDYLENNETAIVRVYAKSYNILRFMSGLAGLAFYE